MTDDAEKLPPKEIDARTLRAIAHPLRMRILTLFWSDGPATATMLAKRLGESTGTLSWHLRHLAEHGLIEEDPDRGTKRERWWRRPDQSVEGRFLDDLREDPDLQGPASVFLDGLMRWESGLVAAFHAQALAKEFGREWLDERVVLDSSWTGPDVRMSPGQLSALRDELIAVAKRHLDAAEAAPKPDAEQVIVLMKAFPYRPGHPST